MLSNLKDLLTHAQDNNYAVGAFNVASLQNIKAVITAAEEEKFPVILQYAQVHEELISMEEIAPIMIDYAHRATVPVAVHFDHGSDFDKCVQAIRLGFTSIMYDASYKDYDVNLRETKEIVKFAHATGVSVEAELGHIFTSTIGGGEGRGDADKLSDYDDLSKIYTDPKLAKEFINETNVDCLAIAFGTAHGIYFDEPVLDLDRISMVEEKVNIPLVMHGGSGISEENYKTAIDNGIRKINFYTYMNAAGGDSVKETVTNTNEDVILFDEISKQAEEAMKNEVKRAIKIFSNKK